MEAMGGPLPARKTEYPAVKALPGSHPETLGDRKSEASTTAAFVAVLKALPQESRAWEISSSDCAGRARTFGYGIAVREYGIYASRGSGSFPVDANVSALYKVSARRQILGKGITRPARWLSCLARRNAYANYGVAMIPF